MKRKESNINNVELIEEEDNNHDIILIHEYTYPSGDVYSGKFFLNS